MELNTLNISKYVAHKNSTAKAAAAAATAALVTATTYVGSGQTSEPNKPEQIVYTHMHIESDLSKRNSN